jgi:RimJ/RimL family protein N-acetyltransferase
MRAADSLEVVPMTTGFLDALLAGRRSEAEHVLSVSLFAGYPDEDERRFLALRLRQMSEDDGFRTWCEHVFVVDRQMIGHGGYNGPPGHNAADAAGAVELGYAIFPPYRGHGHATEAARLLMDAAERRAGIRHFVLAISPDNGPSLAIARKLGFRKTGERLDGARGLEHVFERQ